MSRGQRNGSLLSGNRPAENFSITHLSAQSNVYQDIYFYLKKPNKKTKKRKKSKEVQRISVENLTRHDDVVCK